jgi:hypothetical protein
MRERERGERERVRTSSGKVVRSRSIAETKSEFCVVVKERTSRAHRPPKVMYSIVIQQQLRDHILST